MRILYLLCSIIGLATTYSCNPANKIPLISGSQPSETYHPGRFVWIDLAARDVEVSKRFYGNVLGWTFETIGKGQQSYSIARNQGTPVAGIFPADLQSAKASSGEWIASYSVQDVAAATKMATENGASVIRPAADMAGRGMVSVIKDPQGAIIALLHAKGGDPAITLAPENGWLGMELWTNEINSSLLFYQKMSPYEQEIKQPLTAKAPYVLLKKEGKYAAGVIRNPVESVRAHWVPYFRVKDVKSAMEAVHQNGGKILLAPDPAIRNGSVGIALDPNGAPFALQQYEPK